MHDRAVIRAHISITRGVMLLKNCNAPVCDTSTLQVCIRAPLPIESSPLAPIWVIVPLHYTFQIGSYC